MQIRFLAAAFLLLPLVGCSTVVKQAFYEVRGAQGEFVSQRGARPASLDSYQTVKFRPARSDIAGRLIPNYLVTSFNAAATEIEGELPTGTAVEIETNILFYEGKGLLDAAFFLAHVKFYGGGALLDEGMVKVTSKSFRRGDGEDVARKAAETIANHALGREGGLFGDDDDEEEDRDRD